MEIGEMLILDGNINRFQLEAALKLHKAHGIKLGSCLVKMGFVEEGKLLQLLSEKLYVSLISTEELNKAPERAISALPRELVTTVT